MENFKLTSCFFLIVLLALIYSNSFFSSWHFDDLPNILNNKKIHFTTLNIQSIKELFFTEEGNVGKRPLSYLTFSLNWYLGKDNVMGYHIVNFMIHCLSTIFLYLTLKKIFRTPRLKKYSFDDVQFIILLTTTVWAIHPVQVQAVTYVVQRMTSMAAMFYLLGILLYLTGRLQEDVPKKILFFFGTFFSYVLALLSKENTAFFPLAIILFEILFFPPISLAKLRRYIIPTIGSLIIIGLLGILVFMEGNPLQFLEGYQKRGFGLSERLLTEPRILLFYLSQFFYPVVTHFSLTHDFQISHSLFDPWTTWISILVILALLGLAVHQASKRPLVCLAIFFFFLNHLIESTIIPLELIFEHRNYLPSLFLFLPIAAGIKQALNYYRHHKKSMHIFITSSLACLLIFLGLGTYTRNMTWANEKTLWEDAMEKAPKSARPRHNLGNYYSHRNELEKGYLLNKQALALYDPKPKTAVSLSYYNMAGIHLAQDKYQSAIKYYKKAISVRPDYSKAYYHLAETYLKAGYIEKSETAVNKAINIYSSKNYILLKSLIHMNKEEYDKALSICNTILQSYPEDHESLLHIGIAFMNKYDYNRANFFLNRAHRFAPNDINILFALLANQQNAKALSNENRITKIIFDKYTLHAIKISFQELYENPLFAPIDISIISSILTNQLTKWKKNIKYMNDIDVFYKKWSGKPLAIY